MAVKDVPLPVTKRFSRRVSDLRVGDHRAHVCTIVAITTTAASIDITHSCGKVETFDVKADSAVEVEE